jgi:DNA-binding response OmpR family regulator
MMPYKSGLEITAYSKSKYPNIQVIIVSALEKEDLTVIEGFKLGQTILYLNHSIPLN